MADNIINLFGGNTQKTPTSGDLLRNVNHEDIEAAQSRYPVRHAAEVAVEASVTRIYPAPVETIVTEEYAEPDVAESVLVAARAIREKAA